MKPSFLRRLLTVVCRGLVALGMQHTGGEPGYPYPPLPPERAPVSREPLQGPGPRHPERLRPDIPLSPLEQALQRELEAG
ncbi:DUF6059 family protein [Streptomyces sp. NPDC005408]|uniref:DUF6059 family protein n=1 Tax=Streptomyces sp. NPDC005408 TaxID=3155341 RepID=UPI0033ADC38D